MGFWIYMLIMDLLIPIIMILFGQAFLKKAPKEINYVFGYRTSRSMKIEILGSLHTVTVAKYGSSVVWHSFLS